VALPVEPSQAPDSGGLLTPRALWKSTPDCARKIDPRKNAVAQPGAVLVEVGSVHDGARDRDPDGVRWVTTAWRGHSGVRQSGRRPSPKGAQGAGGRVASRERERKEEKKKDTMARRLVTDGRAHTASGRS